MEIWKDINGYNGLYQVSNQGRVKSLERIVMRSNGRKMYVYEKILKPSISNCGYYRVVLVNSDFKKTIKTIHRLVAETFLPNPDNLPQINHKDECKTNNTVENLEWCTASYNTNYGTRNEKVSKKVLCIELNKVFNSTREIERWLGKRNAHKSISACCLNKKNYRTAFGYHWKYIE